MRLFVGIELPSKEPMQYVGCYILRWSKHSEPTNGFREATEQEIIDAAGEVLGLSLGQITPAPPAE